MGYWGFSKYVTVAERKAKAEKKIASLKKKGQIVNPVCIEGRTIARTFWEKLGVNIWKVILILKIGCPVDVPMYAMDQFWTLLF